MKCTGGLGQRPIQAWHYAGGLKAARTLRNKRLSAIGPRMVSGMIALGGRKEEPILNAEFIHE